MMRIKGKPSKLTEPVYNGKRMIFIDEMEILGYTYRCQWTKERVTAVTGNSIAWT